MKTEVIFGQAADILATLLVVVEDSMLLAKEVFFLAHRQIVT